MEATYKLSADFKKEYPDILWSRIAGLHHFVIHEYYNVDLHIIWDTAINHLPPLKEQLEEVLEEEEGDGS